jgi:polyhydroxyalkanoate synthesis regulator phasin
MVKKSEEKSSNKERIEVKNAINLWVNNSNEFLKLWGDSNLKLYKSWIEFMGEKSVKINDMASSTSPLKYKEFYEDWMKTYKSTFGNTPHAEISSPEKALEGFVKCANESNKLQRDFFESYAGMPDLYSESIAKMAKQIKEVYTRLYVHSDESINKFSDGMEKLSKGEMNPETYKEFYDMWLNIYKENFSKLFDPQTMKSSQELLDNLKESTEINTNMFKSWTEALEKISAKMEDKSKLINDPEAFKEFFNLWVKMFEKTSEDILEGVPTASPLKEMIEPVKSACQIYTNTSVKMSQMWMDSFSRITQKV